MIMRHTPKVAGSTPNKLVDFHNAENQQWPCRMIMRHVKDQLSTCLAWVLSRQNHNLISMILHRQSTDAFLWGGNWAVKTISGD
ncbi:hypothetical protein TNCV_376661 [Trichonephila clavipes]|nr:hypothetical protein TNCV_376661 [Trichonephila clavipes]